jgi:hypothetical protein
MRLAATTGRLRRLRPLSVPTVPVAMHNGECKGNEMSDRQASLFLKRGSLSSRSTASVLAMVVLGGAAAWGAVGALAQRSARHPLTAIAAHTVSVREAVHASEVISRQGNSFVNERGRGTGTFNCPAQVQVRISYTNGSIDLTCLTGSGSLSGGGKLSYFTSGATATFTGTLAIMHGTGKYAHARGRLHVEGSMVRKTFALSATVDGPMSY